jgi:AcrR family transcriptional regulator
LTIVEQSPRRRNAEATRFAILEAARLVFVREGYDAAGLREIAALAGVDPALVSRYFGGKEELFRSVLQSVSDPCDVFHGEPEEFSARVAEMMVHEPYDSPKLDCLQIMLRSANSPRAAEVIRQSSHENFYGPVAQWLGGADGAVKARLLGAVMMGLGVVRTLSPDFMLESEDLATFQDQVQRMIYSMISETA